ncbi:MAG: hypothetical protein FVQ79_12750 [Planctomycetes bacterium]|nr:hypothetical protein [Planctomycetota bacterium]
MDTNYSKPSHQNWKISRRVFLKACTGSLAGLSLCSLSCNSRIAATSHRSTRFGLITDVHYADNDTRGSRFYRDSKDKLTECIELMNEENLDFAIETGDFKDQNKQPVEQQTISHLQTIEKLFQRFNGPTYHVLGNHDMDSISKAQFLSNVKNTNISRDRSYYSFDLNGLHFVVLDANYNVDGTPYDHGNFNWIHSKIPPVELDWLRKDVTAAKVPVIVFIHQLLDGVGEIYVNNAEEVRTILQDCGKVLAVFQGHEHEGSYNQIEGIHYYTLKGMIVGPYPENNSYAIVQVDPDYNITIIGYHNAISDQLTCPTQKLISCLKT